MKDIHKRSILRKTPLLHLKGPRLAIRPPEGNEIERIGAWFDDTETRQNMNVEDPIVPTIELRTLQRRFSTLPQPDREWLNVMGGSRSVLMDPLVKDTQDQLGPPKDIVFSIVRRDGVLVGVIVLRVSFSHLTGTIRTIIAPGFRGRGYGREAKQLILRFGFETLALDKISSFMVETNTANYSCNLACGFRVETVLPNHALIEGKRHGLICMAVMKEDWPRLRGQFVRESRMRFRHKMPNHVHGGK